MTTAIGGGFLRWNKERFSGYWLAKFSGLVICFLLATFFFIKVYVLK